jgi:hypothetical protein
VRATLAGTSQLMLRLRLTALQTQMLTLADVPELIYQPI